MRSLDRVEVFLEVAKNKSFVAAAKALHITGPAASKQVAALEDDLGVKLLHRTTRQVTLTDEGSIFYERSLVAIEEIKDAANQIQDLKAKPKGLLRINAPYAFGHQHLLPALSAFAKKYPDVKMDVSLDDNTVDIVQEGYDLVIRIGVIKDSNLIMKHLADCPIYMVASPEYLNQHGEPKNPSELKNHRVIQYTHRPNAGEWRFKDARGKVSSVKNESCFVANSAGLMLQATLDGVGISMLPAFSCITYIKARQLVHLMPEFVTHPPRQIVALMPPNRYRSQKVRLFLDWIVSACKTIPNDF